MLLSNYITFYNQDFLPYDWHFSEDITYRVSFTIYLPMYSLFESAKKKRILYQLVVTADKFYGGQRIALAPR